jgi:hypothetical protein
MGTPLGNLGSHTDTDSLHQLPPVQSESIRQPTHAPELEQAGVEPPQSALLAQARQVWLVLSQMGVVPPQSVLFRHCTHTLVVELQRGVAPAQLASETQPTQAPEFEQAGVIPPQSELLLQPRQVWVVLSQMGVVPLQFALVTQPTTWTLSLPVTLDISPPPEAVAETG